MKKVVTFGEIMMRLNPPGYLRLKQAHELEVTFAGGESNVAVSVANYGLHSTYVTKLPEGDIGQCAVNELRKYGVDTSQIVRGGPRLGLFFMEKGASQRPSVVIYDRAGSSIALAKPGDFDWAAIFQGADWFHFTGITPALGGDLPAICLEACKKARELGLTISCDINYRKKLWTKQEARAVMEQLMPYVDVCISNEEDATDVFGIQAQSSDVAKGVLNQEDYNQAAAKGISAAYPVHQLDVVGGGEIGLPILIQHSAPIVFAGGNAAPQGKGHLFEGEPPAAGPWKCPAGGLRPPGGHSVRGGGLLPEADHGA